MGSLWQDVERVILVVQKSCYWFRGHTWSMWRNGDKIICKTIFTYLNWQSKYFWKWKNHPSSSSPRHHSKKSHTKTEIESYQSHSFWFSNFSRQATVIQNLDISKVLINPTEDFASKYLKRGRRIFLLIKSLRLIFSAKMSITTSKER